MTGLKLNGCRIAFICGEDEYKSEITLPNLASEVHSRHGAECLSLTAQPDPSCASNLPGLEALEETDLAVVYLRFRQLPEDQLNWIRRYLEAGKPVIGLRTSTHSFRYDEGHPLAAWNRKFGVEVLGAPWIAHFGHSSATNVSVAWGAREHPILYGIPSHFRVRSWLYQVLPFPPQGATVLLNGHTVNPEPNSFRLDTPLIHPVAWTQTHYGGGRVFTTTMGHPEDFEMDAYRRLLINGMYWALDRINHEQENGGESK